MNTRQCSKYFLACLLDFYLFLAKRKPIKSTKHPLNPFEMNVAATEVRTGRCERQSFDYADQCYRKTGSGFGKSWPLNRAGLATSWKSIEKKAQYFKKGHVIRQARSRGSAVFDWKKLRLRSATQKIRNYESMKLAMMPFVLPRFRERNRLDGWSA